MTPSPSELRDILAEILAGAAGNTPAHWRDAIGPVEALPLATNVRSNWRVAPRAGKADMRAIKQAIEIVRAEHPYVAG